MEPTHTSEKLSNVYLTNSWTSIPHGHARSELILISSLLSTYGVATKIISDTPDFGDLYVKKRGLILKLDSAKFRGSLYRFVVNLQLRQNILQLAKGSLLGGSLKTNLIVTSGFFSELEALLKKNSTINLYFRLISSPTRTPNRKILKLISEKIEDNTLILGVETLDGVEIAEKVLGKEIYHVPPLSGIALTKLRKKERHRLGVLWSVTSRESTTQVISFLESLPEVPKTVKLPLNIDANVIEKVFPTIKVIENGITDDKLDSEIEDLFIAIIPHRGYLNRGSGLVGKMLVNGIPVIADISNSFARDFHRFPTFHAMNLDEISTLNCYIQSFALSRSQIERLSKIVHEWEMNSWCKFLGVIN